VIDMIRKRIVFYGRVQGVGFRWRSKFLAADLGLTGWVANEYDGSVIMEVQGPEAMIDRMIIGLQGDRYIDIQDMEVRSLALDEGESSFRVKH